MEHGDLIDALAREGEALGSVRIVDVDVPTCPEWSLPQLVHHVGSVHRWQTAQVRAASPDQLVRIDPPEQPPLNALSGWYRAGLAALLDALHDVGPDALTPTWTFGPQPATFWARRAAHETAIHRWDAEAATTAPRPLAPDQAVDALDELLEVLAPRRFAADTWTGPAMSIHLHATDVDGEWVIRLGPDGLRYEHAHDKADLAARGSASDLVLMIAGRVPPARLELFGDAGVIDQWFRSVKI